MRERAEALLENVTTRRHAETRLAQTDEIFRVLVETVKDYAIFLLDPDGLPLGMKERDESKATPLTK